MERSTTKRLAIASLLAASAYFVLQPASLAHVLQTVRVSNGTWFIDLTDFGYADVAADVRDGSLNPLYFREYLSGEWAAAISHNGSSQAVWFEPRFEFPDWNTNSNFRVTSALRPRDANGDGVPDRNAFGQTIYTSTIRNNKFSIVMTFEFINTRRGMAQGTHPATDPTSRSRVISNRFVLKQTYKITNVSLTPARNVRLYQFLHGLHSTRAVFDHRDYGEASNCAGVRCRQYRYDVTLRGVVRAFVDLQRPFEDVPGQTTRALDISFVFGFGPGMDDAFFRSLLGKTEAAIRAAFQEKGVNVTSPPDFYRRIAQSEFYVINRDVIAFHSRRAAVGVGNVSRAPFGWEVGRYGIRSLGHSHVNGRPPVGVHLAAQRQRLNGRALFDEGNLWVSGAQVYALGNLNPGGMVTMDVLLSISTSQEQTRK